MKRRTKRDLSVLVGALAIVGIVAFVNTQVGRSNLAQEFNELRKRLEEENQTENLLRWSEIRETKGSLRSGGTFTEALQARNGQESLVIGFMVPLEEFRDVTEFMLLPIPLECYFCAIPPDRDIMYVYLREGETASIFAEPVLLRGTFNLHEGPRQQYFYSLSDATLSAALDGGELTKKRIGMEHMLGTEGHEATPEDELLAPVYEDDPDKTD